MSADESALLAAVAADPASDLPRLVYADWLDDHGQAVRAEFIRLQCEIARLDDRPQWERNVAVELYRRQQELLDRHRAELVGDLPDLPDDQVNVVWARGFLSEVTLTADQFFPLAKRLYHCVPLPRVVVTRAGSRLSYFADSLPLADAVAEVRLDDPPATDDNPPLANPEGIEELVKGFGWSHRLDTLDLDRSGLEYVGATLLFTPPKLFPALRRLSLANNALADDAVIPLLNAGLPQRLTRLVLDGNPLTDQSAFELADRLARVATFRTLDFRRTHVTSAGQAALTAAFGSRCNLF